MGRGILQLRHRCRRINVTSVFIMSMALKFMSNRSKKVPLGASDDTFEVGTCKYKWWKSMKISENQWKSVKINGNHWKSMEIIENQWKSMKINGNQFGRPDHLFLARPTPKVPSEALSRTFFDRLDIFSDAIDMINTLDTSIPRHRWHNVDNRNITGPAKI